MLDLVDSLVLVVGFGPKTGVSIARFALAHGARVRAVDNKPAETLQDSLLALNNQVELVCNGEMPFSALDDVSYVVLSPGVPRAAALLVEADRRGIPVMGDIELAWHFSDCRLAGITGTDGKSTTTSMVGSILSQAGAGRVAGNIGIPVLDVIDEMESASILALELSSFMLESIVSFKPEVAAILNLAEDHLDRYPDMEAYLAAKLALFRNLDARSTAVWPLDSPWSQRFAAAIPQSAARITFALQDTQADVCVREDTTGSEAIFVQGQSILPVASLPVLGRHNLRNALAAVAICQALKIPQTLIAQGLLAFRGLSHRFEYAGTAGGVTFVNDSKATTISAVTTAIDSADDRACLLIGGRDKGLDFSPLAQSIKDKGIIVFPFGEARSKVQRELRLDQDGDPSLELAVRRAWKHAMQEGISQVVLAPGCTSYDEFRNFEVRGDFFKALVARLGEEASHGET
jgi:UDP-N-acetylmuramoylalanine--D-glutamate ligase